MTQKDINESLDTLKEALIGEVFYDEYVGYIEEIKEYIDGQRQRKQIALTLVEKIATQPIYFTDLKKAVEAI